MTRLRDIVIVPLAVAVVILMMPVMGALMLVEAIDNLVRRR